MTKVLTIGGCNTNIGKANGARAYLKWWNWYICSSCLAHILNLTVKNVATEIVETNLLKDLKHQVYQFFENSNTSENIFGKLQEV